MTSSLSLTASFIAVKFYGLTLNPKIADHFDPFVPKFYEDVVTYLPKKLSWHHSALHSKMWRNFFVWWEELLLPGDLMHIISRKYYATSALEKAIESGFQQVVVLGAGFDHSGAFFASKGVPVFEIDTPQMIAHKCNMLQKYEYESTDLYLCPIDPSNQNIKEVLAETNSFNFDKKTVFLAEGFFDYLSLGSVRSVLQNITDLGKNIKLISTFFDLEELKPFHRLVFKSGVSMVGETLKLPIRKNDFMYHLSEFGMVTTSVTDYKEIENEFISKIEIDLPVLTGFYIIESSFNQ
ncbi:MAG: class I SAM-dependent methyltransferase [Balneola sp.]